MHESRVCQRGPSLMFLFFDLADEGREENTTISGHGCILEGISFLSISSILLPTRKSGIRRDKYLSAAIFKEAVHSDDS